jgi:hypothetical protein
MLRIPIFLQDRVFFQTFSFPYVTLLNNFQSFTIFEYYLRKFWYFSMGKPNKLSWTRCSKNSDQKINFRNSLSERHLFAKVNKNLIFDDICLSNSRITQLRQEGEQKLQLMMLYIWTNDKIKLYLSIIMNCLSWSRSTELI